MGSGATSSPGAHKERGGLAVYPVIDAPGGIELRTHVLFLIAAVASVHLLAPYWAKRTEGLSPLRTWLGLVGLGVGAFVGGRLHFVANAWEIASYARQPGETLRFWNGLHAGGSLVGIVVSCPLVLRLVRLPMRQFLDAAVPAMCVGIAVARLGCFANGCCFGTVCHGPTCLAFRPESMVHGFHVRLGLVERPAWSLPVHPLPLYFAASALVAAAFGTWFQSRKAYHGQVALVATATYLTLAALVEPLRAEYYPPGYSWDGTLQFEWIAYGLAAMALSTLLGIESRRRLIKGRAPGAAAGELSTKSRLRP